MVIVMARIYSICGDYDKAMDEIEYLLSMEESITVNDLYFWVWVDPYRHDPRLKQIVGRYRL